MPTPSNTPTPASSLSFRQPIDRTLRRTAGILGAGFVGTAVLLMVAVRPGLFGLGDMFAWMACGLSFGLGVFLVAASFYGVERVVTIDPRAATLDEEFRTFGGFSAHVVRPL